MSDGSTERTYSQHELQKYCYPDIFAVHDISLIPLSSLSLSCLSLSLDFTQHAEELSELRLGVEQVTERELEMAKRLEDFIVQSQDQNAMLQAEVSELRNLLAVREEQLASATFR